ncbi:MAG: CBS domain-containing protein [Pirellulales bacterium]|nr:CBS domain-containing protein [Pirellulales bacterium]
MTKDCSCLDSLVRDWMSSPVHSVCREATVREVLEMMKQERLSSIPVRQPGGAVAGIVTLGDLARVVMSTEQLLESDYPHYEDWFWVVDLIQRKLGSDKVYSVMSEGVATTRPTQTMREAAVVMRDAGIRHLPVTTTGHELVGMLSASDFVRMVANQPATHGA